MTNNSSDRLDRIERVLDTLATNQVNERDARLELKEDLEILYQTVQVASERTDSAINSLASRLDQLGQTMTQFAENAEADRAAMRETQAEIRQIWQYLLSQQPNGHS